MSCFTDDVGPLAFMMAAKVVAKAPVVEVVVEEAKGATTMLWEGTKMMITGTVKSCANMVPTVLADKTPLEKKLIIGMGCYGAWLVYRSGCAKYVSTATSYIVPGYNWVKTRFGPMRVQIRDDDRTKSNMLESRREGSHENDFTMPGSQAKVGVISGKTFYVQGSCIRLTPNTAEPALTYLVGPDHVLGGTSEKWVWGSQNKVSLLGKERLILATDLVAIQMTEAEMSTIGLATAKVGSVSSMGALAQIVGPESKGTVGRLINDPASFGRVIYYGTTLAGYSGSPYCLGTHVVGIHQMGGEMNGGYAASYALSCLKSAIKTKPEGSDDWLLGQMTAGKKLKWMNTGDPDEVQVCIDGLYTVVTKTAMSKAFGREWSESPEISQGRRNRYQDGEFESLPGPSGESRPSTLPGVSSGSANIQDSSRQEHQKLMYAFSQLSRSKAKEFLKLLRSLSGQQLNMSGPENVAESAN